MDQLIQALVDICQLLALVDIYQLLALGNDLSLYLHLRALLGCRDQGSGQDIQVQVVFARDNDQASPMFDHLFFKVYVSIVFY
jgi:hypothetical protein